MTETVCRTHRRVWRVCGDAAEELAAMRELTQRHSSENVSESHLDRVGHSNIACRRQNLLEHKDVRGSGYREVVLGPRVFPSRVPFTMMGMKQSTGACSQGR